MEEKANPRIVRAEFWTVFYTASLALSVYCTLNMAMQATAFFLSTGVIGISYNRWECFLDCELLLSINHYSLTLLYLSHSVNTRTSLRRLYQTAEERLDLFTSQQNHGRLPIIIPAQERPSGLRLLPLQPEQCRRLHLHGTIRRRQCRSSGLHNTLPHMVLHSLPSRMRR